ncbi:MAG: phosphate ABC transporter substrate-binding protein PstS [Candidatus Margulisiibacteriota bacterium]|jgi:phosphate transport system substrate-binding protein
MIKKTVAIVISLVLIAGAALAVSLNGAGATFPYPIYVKWNKMFADKTGTQVNYQGIGSGGGIRQFAAKITDFGGSDAPMTEKQMSDAGGDILHIPTVMGAVAVSYNLPGVKGLRLDQDTLGRIFLGRIKKWDDPAIAALNPGADLPSKSVLIAHRSDGSGTTHIFTSYLAKVSTAWAAEVGAGSAVSWPTGIGGKGNAGVAGVIKGNEGAIGYVELSYAISNDLPVVSLKNRSGKYVKPSIASTTAAADGALGSSKLAKQIAAGDFRLDLTNAPGKDSYPIVGMTWILVRQKLADAEKGNALKNYLKWALTEGQQYAGSLLYAPLPESMADKVLRLINSIEIE